MINIRIGTLKFGFCKKTRINSLFGKKVYTRISLNQACIRLNTILGFQYRASTRLRLQTFKIRLENESRVGTPLRRNLDGTTFHFFLTFNAVHLQRYKSEFFFIFLFQNIITSLWETWARRSRPKLYVKPLHPSEKFRKFLNKQAQFELDLSAKTKAPIMILLYCQNIFGG